jgi:flagellar protein FlgJ
MQNQISIGPAIRGQVDLLTKSGERLESQIRTAEAARTTSRSGDLKKVSQEFESLFISYLLKVMRETIEESGLTESGFGKSIYTDLFDQELSRSVAKRGGLGIADLLYRRLSEAESSAPGPEEEKKEGISPSTPLVVPESHRIGQNPLESEREIPDFLLPVRAPVSSGYGLRKDPFNGHAAFHKGIDLAAPAGTEVLAPWGGKVVSVNSDPGYGNYVVVEHPQGFQTRYAHLASAGVRVGDRVSAGQSLGTVGSSGRSTGPHLHFEVMRHGAQVDPGSLSE